MIRRETGSTDLLITQDDHGILAGQILQHWGNSQFDRPERAAALWRSVVSGARYHDAGWPLHDDAPTLNHDHRPLDVFETPVSIALKVWAASADRAAEQDPYGGLLVSLHILTLAAELLQSDQRGSSARSGDDPHARFAINKFQHREIERQEQLRKQLDLVATSPLTLGLAPQGTSAAEEMLRLHFRAVQAADSFSLGLCCNQPPSRQTRPLLPKLGAFEQKLTQRCKGDVLRVHPWPLDEPQLTFSIPARSLAARRYQTDAQLQAAWASAPAVTLHLTMAAD